jgi:hypothetical protein
MENLRKSRWNAIVMGDAFFFLLELNVSSSPLLLTLLVVLDPPPPPPPPPLLLVSPLWTDRDRLLLCLRELGVVMVNGKQV